jgi:pimeloyl-ACP methyl ester carboxylesterase
MDKPTLDTRITEDYIETSRLKMHVLFSGNADGEPVVFLHGNFSAALYWQDLMLSLPEGYRGIAFDMRGYGWTEDKLIDGSLGMREWSDDLAALMDALSLEKVHLVGWSLGGGVLYRFIIDHPQRIKSVALVAPVSPYGFGGTKGIDGIPCFDDFAGSGGGVVNPEFVSRIKAGDRTAEDPNSPRNVINVFYYKAPFRAAREEDFLTASLAEKMGDNRYPGDATPSSNWPMVAPGKWGPINAGSPKYVIADAAELIAAPNKPPVLWVRGAEDMIVSDNSMFDLGALGKLGYVPGWPGDEVYPPQPMVGQTRDVLEKYAAQGGEYQEAVIADTGHGVFIEKQDEFNTIFHAFIAKNSD